MSFTIWSYFFFWPYFSFKILSSFLSWGTNHSGLEECDSFVGILVENVQQIWHHSFVFGSLTGISPRLGIRGGRFAFPFLETLFTLLPPAWRYDGEVLMMDSLMSLYVRGMDTLDSRKAMYDAMIYGEAKKSSTSCWILAFESLLRQRSTVWWYGIWSCSRTGHLEHVLSNRSTDTSTSGILDETENTDVLWCLTINTCALWN